MTSEITVDYNETKRRHEIFRDDRRSLLVVCHGQRREGELWLILDAGYAKLVELRGSTAEKAVDHAVGMLRDGTVDRMIEDRLSRDRRALVEVGNALMA